MTSIKKIALAVAMSVALAGTALPANATTPPVGSVATNPYLVPVPDTGLITDANVVDLTVTGLAHDTAVTVRTSNALVSSTVSVVGTDVKVGHATASLVGNSLNSDYVHIYALTTSTAVGSVAITVGGNTTTTYIQGIAGGLNNISATSTGTGAIGTNQDITITATDVFGNVIEGALVNVITTINGIATTDIDVTNAKGIATHTVTIPKTGTVTVLVYATVADAIVGLTAPVGSVSLVINARDYATELATANALVATLTAQLAKAQADGVLTVNELNRIKKLYNKLAKKWNVRHKNAKVALLK
jgi:hypothetical protein